MQFILWPIVSWIFREVLVKFVIFAALFALLAVLMPLLVGHLAGFVELAPINSAIANIPSGVVFFMRLLRFDIGLPLVVSAIVSRFLIRRIPVIG